MWKANPVLSKQRCIIIAHLGGKSSTWYGYTHKKFKAIPVQVDEYCIGKIENLLKSLTCPFWNQLHLQCLKLLCHVMSLLFHSTFSNAMFPLHLATHRFRCTAQMSDGPALAFRRWRGQNLMGCINLQKSAKEFLMNLGHLLIWCNLIDGADGFSQCTILMYSPMVE